eukprot:365347-Chlamydomonas_euryale.AAC.3
MPCNQDATNHAICNVQPASSNLQPVTRVTRLPCKPQARAEYAHRRAVYSRSIVSWECEQGFCASSQGARGRRPSAPSPSPPPHNPAAMSAPWQPLWSSMHAMPPLWPPSHCPGFWAPYPAANDSLGSIPPPFLPTPFVLSRSSGSLPCCGGKPLQHGFPPGSQQPPSFGSPPCS